MIFPSTDVVNLIREQYPAGTRVELVKMNDQYQKMEKGLTGTVTGVDDIGTIHVNWDNGSTLGVVYGADSCKKTE